MMRADFASELMAGAEGLGRHLEALAEKAGGGAGGGRPKLRPDGSIHETGADGITRVSFPHDPRLPIGEQLRRLTTILGHAGPQGPRPVTPADFGVDGGGKAGA